MDDSRDGVARSGESDLTARSQRRALHRALHLASAEGSTRPRHSAEPDRRSREECEREIESLRARAAELEAQDRTLRRAEARLENDRARYRDLYELAPVPYFVLSSEGNILEANRLAVVLLGLVPGEAIGEPFTRFILPEDRDLFEIGPPNFFPAIRPQACELRMLRRGGAMFWARLEATVEQPPGGGSPICRLTACDISEHKAVETQLAEGKNELQEQVVARTAALAANNAQLEKEIAGRQAIIQRLKAAEETMAREINLRRTIIERASEGLYVRHEVDDVTVSFIVWNERMREITGYTIDEINRVDWRKALFSEGQGFSRMNERLIRMREGQDLQMEEWPLTRADGTRRVVLISTATLDVTKRERHVLGIMCDVSELKKSQDALQHANQAQHQAEKLAATGRLAARVAHEINNPLAGIKNAFRIFRRVIPSSCPEYAYVPRVEAELDRVVRIVRQMYDLHRPGPDRTVTVRLDEECREVCSLLEAVLRQREIFLELAEPLPEIRAQLPEGAVRQILMNLVTNAVDASPEGAIVTVTMTWADDHAVLSVADRGVGMSEEVRSRIFEPFFSTKVEADSASGLGLGLSISRQLAESFHGTLECESIPGKGTTFRLHVPFVSVKLKEGSPWTNQPGS